MVCYLKAKGDATLQEGSWILHITLPEGHQRGLILNMFADVTWTPTLYINIDMI